MIHDKLQPRNRRMNNTILLPLHIKPGIHQRDGKKDISFTVAKNRGEEAVALMKEYTENLGAEEILYDDKVAKISIVGAGMESHAGVATKMFEALYDAQVNIQMISTSEIKVSVLIDSADADKAVSAIHSKFFD